MHYYIILAVTSWHQNYKRKIEEVKERSGTIDRRKQHIDFLISTEK